MDNLSEAVFSLSINQHTESNPKDKCCPVCQEKATNTCSACKSVDYCCAGHQKLDWKNHKKVCQPFTIEEAEGMGKGWFATRDLEPGTLLVEESPTLQASSWPEFGGRDGGGLKCVTCGVKSESMKTCSACSWPVCSDQCEKNSLHSDNECKEFSLWELEYPPPAFVQSGMLVMAVRANGIKTRDPRKFKQLLDLQQFYEPPHQQAQEAGIHQKMFELFRGPNPLEYDEFRKLLRVCTVNGFNAECTHGHSHFEDGSREFKFRVYLKTSRVNHSCYPNCTASFSPAPDNKILIRTIMQVSKGQQLTLNYFDGETDFFDSQSTAYRQNLIKKNHRFICKCKKCLDPTELGTFRSGIKCSSCSSHLKADSGNMVGFLLPAHPLEIDSPDPVYECHRCHVQFPLSKVLTNLPKTVRHACRNIENWINSSPTSLNIKSLENLLTKFEEGREFKDHLSRNHWLLQAAMRRVTKVQMKKLDKMTEEELHKLVDRLQFLVEDKLYPGLLYQMRYWDLMQLYDASVFLQKHFSKGMDFQRLAKLNWIVSKTQNDKFEFLQRIGVVQMVHSS